MARTSTTQTAPQIPATAPRRPSPPSPPLAPPPPGVMIPGHPKLMLLYFFLFSLTLSPPHVFPAVLARPARPQPKTLREKVRSEVCDCRH